VLTDAGIESPRPSTICELSERASAAWHFLAAATNIARGEVDDDTLLYEIARRALGGPGDEGRASYQIAVTRCEDCGRTSIDAGGRSHPVDDAVAEMAACDGQHLGPLGGTHPRPHDDEGAPGAGPHDGPHAGAPAPKRARATQTIPPAVRRAVVRRDRRRCVVPGCENHVFLDVHHLDPRAEGGGHDPERLAVLCGGHHRSVHLGHLRIEGTASEGFSVRHGDGTPHGQALSPPRLELTSLALGALRHMGFKPTQAQRRVDAVLAMDAVPADPAAFIRAALLATC
jgi:hypothetical protein